MPYEAWRITYQSSEQAARAAYARVLELEAQVQRAPLAEPINHAAHRPTFDGKDWFMTEIREMSPQKIGQLYLHWKMYGDFSVEPFAAGVRYAERAHGIGKEQP